MLVLIAGALSYIAIPKESDPDIDIPIIYVSMSHEGNLRRATPRGS